MVALLFVGVVEQLGNEAIFVRFFQSANNVYSNTNPRQQAEAGVQACLFAFFFGILITSDDCHNKDASEIVKKKCNKGIHRELARCSGWGCRQIPSRTSNGSVERCDSETDYRSISHLAHVPVLPCPKDQGRQNKFFKATALWSGLPYLSKLEYQSFAFVFCFVGVFNDFSQIFIEIFNKYSFAFF